MTRPPVIRSKQEVKLKLDLLEVGNACEWEAIIMILLSVVVGLPSLIVFGKLNQDGYYLI